MVKPRISPSGPLAPESGARFIRRIAYNEPGGLALPSIAQPLDLFSFVEDVGRLYQMVWPFTLAPADSNPNAPVSMIAELYIDAERITLGSYCKFGGPASQSFAGTWMVRAPAGAVVRLTAASLLGSDDPILNYVNSGNAGGLATDEITFIEIDRL